MKFKIEKGTKLFEKFEKLRVKMHNCNNKAADLVKEMGFERYHRASLSIAGGIAAVYSEKKPKGFVSAYPRQLRAWYPKKNKGNKELLEKIRALPVVTYDTLNSIINYDGFDTLDQKTARISFCPEVTWKKNYVLIGIPEFVNYKPIKNMVEITTTEYKKFKSLK